MSISTVSSIKGASFPLALSNLTSPCIHSLGIDSAPQDDYTWLYRVECPDQVQESDRSKEI